MITAAAVVLALTASSGPGWSVGEGDYLDTAPWAVFFYDQRSLDRTRHYVDLVEEQLEAHIDVDVKVTSSFKAISSGCVPPTSTGYHVIVVRWDPAEDRSYVKQCLAGNAMYSSRLIFSGENWDTSTRSGSSAAYRRNVTSHEMAHALGVGHPADCVQPGTDPLMCGAYWGGYGDVANAHKFTPYDVRAFDALLENRP